MNYLTAVHTDVGIKKATNQDSLFLETAATDYGRVVLAVICDGMGGLAKGEVASAVLVRDFADWFHRVFPGLLYGGLTPETVKESWERLILDTNQKITEYGLNLHVSLGTTVTALLLVDGTYFIINVGDSRAYLLDGGMNQLTVDQTFVQREVDMGRMTPEEARVSPQRNVLLQCVGASGVIEPDFYVGQYRQDQVLMLCSDGFRHVISPSEFYERLNPAVLTTEERMKESAVYFTELNKARNETDNISVILIRVC